LPGFAPVNQAASQPPLELTAQRCSSRMRVRNIRKALSMVVLGRPELNLSGGTCWRLAG